MAADLVITRTFKAPRELLFQVWTEAEHLKQWWGPKGFAMEVATQDLRPGGTFHYSMRSPAGQEMWGKFVYEQAEAPSRLVYVNSFSDAAGNVIRHPIAPTWPLEVHNTLTFTEQDGTTTLTLEGGPINATEEERNTFLNAREGVKQGFAGTLDQLEAYLTSIQK